jgi:hypothetical protein
MTLVCGICGKPIRNNVVREHLKCISGKPRDNPK